MIHMHTSTQHASPTVILAEQILQARARLPQVGIQVREQAPWRELFLGLHGTSTPQTAGRPCSSRSAGNSGRAAVTRGKGLPHRQRGMPNRQSTHEREGVLQRCQLSKAHMDTCAAVLDEDHSKPDGQSTA